VVLPAKKSFCGFLSAIKVAEANKDLRLYHTAMVGGGVWHITRWSSITEVMDHLYVDAIACFLMATKLL
jgi:hypothetical protein